MCKKKLNLNLNSTLKYVSIAFTSQLLSYMRKSFTITFSNNRLTDNLSPVHKNKLSTQFCKIVLNCKINFKFGLNYRLSLIIWFGEITAASVLWNLTNEISFCFKQQLCKRVAKNRVLKIMKIFQCRFHF